MSISIRIDLGWYKGELPSVISIDIMKFSYQDDYVDILIIKIIKFIISISIGGLYQ